MVRDVQFETMPMFVPLAYVPNDPDFGNQWDMRRIRAGGAGHTAWNINRGNSSVVICVLDTGCDLGHPDLDFVSDGINVGAPGSDGSPIAGPTTAIGHGTACAGIAAATIHNATGVAGVAGGCQILPVAFTNWTDAELARGIRYATQNGAHVLSMSLVSSPSSFINRLIIGLAIQDAFDHNVVLCAATGNGNSESVAYPARHPLVMACGASDQDDNRKTPTSPDGETWWGSNFGAEINVVAPGVLIPTTDVQGSAGYDSGDYFMTFNGTSAATPHVAGLAALLISANDTLSNVEVQEIIERTADKVGDRLYLLSGPNGSWNEEMGYGRINAYRALKAAVIRGGVFVPKVEFDKSGVFDAKPELDEKMTKLEVPVDPGEEVKRAGGYESPFGFDRRILEHILERLERLEQRTGGGQPFIPRSERPDVGGDIARRANENE
jgi:subtilisin family serine protease